MMMDDLLQRITFDQRVLRGMRISVDMILELLAKGSSQEEILDDYPVLEMDDIRAVLAYAQHLVAGEMVLDQVTV